MATDPTQDDNRRRRMFVASAALSGAFVLGLLIAGHRTPPTRSTPGTVTSPTKVQPDHLSAAGPGPTGLRWGIPTGFARTDDGAAAAGVGYVLTGAAFMNMAPTQVPDAIALMSAKASTPARVDEAQTKLTQLRKVLSGGQGPTQYLQAALAVRVEAFTVDRARVSVWAVGVLSRDGAAVPQAGWTISTFELVWEGGDWKVWSEQIAPGPTPDLNAGDRPATSTDFGSRLHGFTAWGLPR